jgi:hypothetical protein
LASTRITGEARPDLLDEPGDIVQAKPWSEIAEIAGGYPEGLPPGGGAPAR